MRLLNSGANCFISCRKLELDFCQSWTSLLPPQLLLSLPSCSAVSYRDGFVNTFYNFRISSGLRGQYVCPSTLQHWPMNLSAYCSPPYSLNILFIFIVRHIGKMLVILRDGRKLHGVLRSYDQFGGLLIS